MTPGGWLECDATLYSQSAWPLDLLEVYSATSEQAWNGRDPGRDAQDLPDEELGVLGSTTRVPASLDHATGVFDRFHSADPRSMHNRGGAALGLAITAAILEAHHGRIELHTAPRHGTTFCVLVPLA
jgi:hypothetical protein